MKWIDFAGHASFLLTAFSFCVRDIVFLRILAIVSAMVGICYNYFVGPLWLVIFWLAVFSIINLYQLLTMYFEQKAIKFSADEKELFDTQFSQMTPVEFMKLMRIGEWKEFEKGTVLAHQGKELESLYLIYSGEVEVSKDGRSVAHCKDGSLIGEVSFLSADRATADVTTEVTTKCLLWRFEDLKALLRRNPAIHLAMQGVFSTDLTKKLGAPSAPV